MSSQTRHSIAAILALVVGLWAAPAYADLFTVDWDVVPHEERELFYDDSPFYDCNGSRYANRLCSSLWDTGLALDKLTLSVDFYDDVFVEGIVEERESSIGPWSGVLQISPECKKGLGPCFESFTPLTLALYGYSFGPPANLFVLSSRGGLVKTADDSVPIVFGGSEWQNLDWIQVGFYIPQICEDGPSEEDEELCRPNTVNALALGALTFEADAVPEPGLLSLLAAGALGLGARRRYRA